MFRTMCGFLLIKVGAPGSLLTDAVANHGQPEIRVGKWYTVEAKHGVITLSCIEDRLKQAEPVVLAWDIETTKLPLKFPDATIDQIMMISYMIEGQVSFLFLQDRALDGHSIAYL